MRRLRLLLRGRAHTRANKRTNKRTNSALQGHALLVTIVTTLVIGLTLAGYLNMVSNQHLSTMRALAWNTALPVLEAGIEEALSHLHKRGLSNLGIDGWVDRGGVYVKDRFLGNSRFEVSIEPVEPPIIISTGYVPTPAPYDATPRYVSRKVRVETRRDPLFSHAMLAKDTIDLNGKNIQTDSFDSADPLYNTGGKYDPAKTKGKGDVATNSGLVDSLSAGNALVKGHASTGHGGNVAIGAGGSIGSKTWVESGSKGIEPGYVSDDMNVEFPDVLPPFEGGYSTPTSATVGDVSYTYVLGTGDYKLSSFKGSVLVTGQATLWVTDVLQFSGKDFIKIAPGASLKLYVSAPTAYIGGRGIINETSNAASLQYYGMPSNTKLSFAGNASFTGAIYAPQAEFLLGGGGQNTYDFIGASITKTVRMNGHFNFHYDEDLARHGPYRPYVANSWNEI